MNCRKNGTHAIGTCIYHGWVDIYKQTFLFFFSFDFLLWKWRWPTFILVITNLWMWEHIEFGCLGLWVFNLSTIKTFVQKSHANGFGCLVYGSSLSTMNIFIHESHANGLGNFCYHINTIWLFIACDISLGFVGSTLKTMVLCNKHCFLT
jgi:hypothetical protein